MTFYILLYIFSFLISSFIYLIIRSGLLGNNLHNKFNIFDKNNQVKFTVYIFIVVSITSFIIMPDSVIYFIDN